MVLHSLDASIPINVNLLPVRNVLKFQRQCQKVTLSPGATTQHRLRVGRAVTRDAFLRFTA